MQYKDYEVEDFLLDESFQEWVNGDGDNKFWENWLLNNPERREIVNAAKVLLLNTVFYESTIKGEEVEEELHLLSNKIKKINDKKQRFLYSFFSWEKIAASILILVIATLGYHFYYRLQTVTLQTAYGETKTETLPDGSKVILNSNSELSFRSDFKENKERIIYLKGEAFFEVTHTSDNKKFIVKTNGIQITVLGTKFNVNGRRGEVKVILKSGKVKVSDPRHNTLIMKPGEMVHYSQENEKYSKTLINSELHTSWRDNRLKFKNTPVKEIIQLLNDNYGISVVIKDKSIEKRKLTGNYPADKIDILIKSMAEVFGLKLIKKDKEIILGNNL